MAEAQGTIIVSTVCTADLSAVVDCLNHYCWSDCDSKFAIVNGGIRFSPYAEYPTVFPRYDQFLGDDDRTDDDHDFDEVALQTLAAAVHEEITTGFVELSAVSVHQNYGAWFETLRIDSDGIVKACRFGRSILQAPSDEEYFWKL